MEVQGRGEVGLIWQTLQVAGFLEQVVMQQFIDQLALPEELALEIADDDDEVFVETRTVGGGEGEDGVLVETDRERQGLFLGTLHHRRLEEQGVEEDEVLPDVVQQTLVHQVAVLVALLGEEVFLQAAQIIGHLVHLANLTLHFCPDALGELALPREEQTPDVNDLQL